ncbi:MAG: DUF3179 domain-containing protein [Aureibaculum sp.]|nr:DUF3179 domain-containing protein [Aureibaculum sp.]
MKNNILILIFSVLLIMSCGGGDEIINPSTNGGSNTGGGGNNTGGGSNINLNDWLIPVAEVRDGGPGKDGIASIDNPRLSLASEVSSAISDDLLVIGIKVGNEVKAYPHFIMDWHEIVNDNLEDVSVAVTYCPLTGTAIGWDRIVNGSGTTFGVSGLLYNSNLIPYDRNTDSNWSQIRLECVNGELIGEKPAIIPLVETTWGVFKSMYPEAKILDVDDTGFSINYGFYPYGDYRTNNARILFPISPWDDRLPAKERVLAIIDNQESKVFRFNSFGQGNVINDVFNGEEILVVGNQDTMVSFGLDDQTSLLNFEYAYNGSETLFKDNEGTEWNIFGEAISGPGTGNKLNPKTSFMGYWFSIGAFYTNTEIYSN